MDQTKKENEIRDRFALKLLFTDQTDLNDEVIAYFKEHPDDIDDITAPVNVHKFFLWFGSLLGIGLVIVSKLIEVQTLTNYIHLKEVLVSIVFEVGVALIGGGVTAYLLGILYGYDSMELYDNGLFPLLQLYSDLDYKNVGVQFSWAGSALTVGFLIRL